MILKTPFRESSSGHESYFRLNKPAAGGGYRLPLEVSANGVPRLDRPVEVELNLTALLQPLEPTASVSPQGFRLVEVDTQNQVLNQAVPFQFDPASRYDVRTNAAGTLVFLLPGVTSATGTRRFHLLIDPRGSTSPTVVSNQVAMVHDPPVVYQDQASYQILTPAASYYYHIYGAGFAALLDHAGNDWISYRPAGGSAGNYRGIPNLVYPEGHFHPGNNSCSSSVTRVGPLKISIYSESQDTRWACAWDFFPGYARLTVLRTNGPYWFLYEGTPGGKLEPASGLCHPLAGHSHLGFALLGPGPGRTGVGLLW